MQKFLNRTSLITLFFSHLSCGEMDNSFLKDIIYKVDGNKVEVGAVFQNYLSLALDVEIKIKDHGTLKFYPTGDLDGAKISFQIDPKIYKDSEVLDKMKRTSKLPNGADLPSYVETDLLRLKFNKQKRVVPSLYLGTEEEEKYLGTSLELYFLDERFPEKLIISQRFFDQNKRPVGVATIFGPSLTRRGDLKVPGGIFFATNISDLEEYLDQGRPPFEDLIPGRMEITLDGENHVLSEAEALELMVDLQNALEEFNREQQEEDSSVGI